MNKKDIIKKVAENTGMTQKDVTAIVDTFVDAVMDFIKDGSFQFQDLVHLKSWSVQLVWVGIQKQEWRLRFRLLNHRNLNRQKLLKIL